jgi:transcriptional regulator with XRE-family HTH domain
MNEIIREHQYIAALLREARLKHPEKYSQSQLANKLGYKNGQFISNIERGKCGIPFKNMLKLSEILDIPKKDIVNASKNDLVATLNYLLPA